MATYAMAIGAGGSTSTLNTGRFFITLKPRAERDASACQVIARLRPQLEKVEGARLFLQAAQDVNVGGRACAHAVPIHPAGRQSRRAERVGAQGAREAQDAAGAARRGLGPADVRHGAHAHHRSRSGVPLRADAAAHRRHALRRLRPAPGGAILHAAEQLPRGDGDPAGAAGRREQPRQDLHQVADDRAAGAAGGLRQMDDARDRSRSRSATRASFLPSPSASTWRRERRSAPPRRRSSKAEREHADARLADRHLPGQRPGVPGVAAHRAAADRSPPCSSST